METREISSMSQRRANTSLDQRVREFAEHHGYYDVFFIGTGGDVLFTMAREADYGTNLLTGPYARTGLGHLFQRLAQVEGDGIAFEDFSLYPPSNDQPAAFLGARVYANEEWIGIYAIQIPESPINEVMQFSAGMGTSGETYLVAADGLMRSTSRFFDQSTVLRTRVEGPTVDRALAGSIGLEIVDDYRGVPVYSAYRRFEFEGVHWAVLAEQDVAEIQAPLIQLRWWLTAGLLLLALMMVLLRFMLTRIVLPSSIAALLGLSFVLDAHD
jgi:methyl-accepting chemotaxis protein